MYHHYLVSVFFLNKQVACAGRGLMRGGSLLTKARNTYLNKKYPLSCIQTPSAIIGQGESNEAPLVCRYSEAGGGGASERERGSSGMKAACSVCACLHFGTSLLHFYCAQQSSC